MKVRLKKVIACLMAVILVVGIAPITVFAAETVQSGQIGDNVYYTLDDAGTLTISGTGAMWDYDFIGNYSPFCYLPPIKSVIIKYGVTTIGNSVFYASDFTSVTIPDSVTSIGEGAFDSCYSLTSVTIPDSVTSIGNFAFFMCCNLENISIPESVISIGYDAFTYTGLYYNEDNWENNVLYIDNCLIVTRDSYGEGSSIVDCSIKSGTRLIADHAFSECYNLRSVTIPDSVVIIGNGAFEYCENLEDVTIGKGVTTIGDAAFNYCYRLSVITIPDSVSSMGAYIFAD